VRRIAIPLLVGAFVALLTACDPLVAPARPKIDGYRARVALRSGGVEKASFEIAVRGDLRRKGPPDSTALVLDVASRLAFRLDPAAKTFHEVPFAEAVGELPAGIPLAPGFDEAAEAVRRGLKLYHREGDEVFAGHVCALWRFDDDPSVPGSPTTTYWVAVDLDNLVVRYDRETTDEKGKEEKSTVSLTNVRVGADPGLFSAPAGWSRL
jgi:hypothetical protein